MALSTDDLIDSAGDFTAAPLRDCLALYSVDGLFYPAVDLGDNRVLWHDGDYVEHVAEIKPLRK